MLPQPLHPAVVHLPMAIVVLLPFAALAALIMIRRGAAPRAAWAWVVALSILLAGTSWLAVETGESQEDAVEEVVGDAAIHAHEEAAERFLPLTAAAVLLLGAGLARGRVGRFGRLAGLAGTLVLLFAGYRVGHSGGELVYTHGAAQAYAGPGATQASARSGAERGSGAAEIASRVGHEEDGRSADDDRDDGEGDHRRGRDDR